MTPQGAIEIIKNAIAEVEWLYPMEYAEAFETAVTALERQIPKKPIGRHTDYKCSVCGRRVRSGKGSSSHIRDNVCQRCFQVLDWSDAE